VEPDDALREAVTNALGVAIPVVATGDGAQAIHLLHEQLPTIALVNIQRGAIDGFALLREVRRCLAAPKVIVTSDSGDYNLVRRVGEIGVGDFIEKPYRLEDLFNAVDNSIRGVPSAVDYRSLSARYNEQSRNRRHLLLNVA